MLVDYGIYEDFYSKRICREIGRLGQKLTLVGGTLAPVVVLLSIELRMKPEYAAHVAQLWGLNDIDEAAIEEDGIPTLAMAE